MEETVSIYPIRGQHHRKPAPTILSLLAVGTVLSVRREPTNEHDVNAIQVWADLASDEFAELRAAVEMDVTDQADSTVTTPDWENPVMLGYIGREFAAVIAPKMDEAGIEELPARLASMADGKPGVEIGSDEGAEVASPEAEAEVEVLEEEEETVVEEETSEEDDPGDISEEVDPDAEPTADDDTSAT